MYRFRINSVSVPKHEDIVLADMVVIIGPNNAGKSQFLKDLLASSTERNTKRTIVTSIGVDTPASLSEFLATYDMLELQRNNRIVLTCLGTTLYGPWTSHELDSAWQTDFSRDIAKDKDREREYFTYFLGSRVVGHLPTESRLALARIGKGITEQDEVKDLYAALYYAGPEGEQEFRKAFEATFSKPVVFDFSVPGRFSLRIGQDAVDVPPDPRAALRHYRDKNVPVLHEQGDGVRAYAGLLLAFIVSKKPVLLIDEPELFLHPLLARKMGEYIGSNAGSAKHRQVVLTTHDANMLSGIVKANPSAQVLRITRPAEHSAFRSIDGTRIAELAGDPVLGKEKVLEGLFHEAVVLTEGDADLKVMRLLCARFFPHKDIHVVDTNGKRSMAKCREFFALAGVPALSILDFDVFNDKPTLQKFLTSVGLSGTAQQDVLAFQKALAEEVHAQPVEEKIERLKTLAGDLYGHFSKADLENVDQEELFAEARRLSNDIRLSSSEWNDIKQRGRGALSPQLALKFDECEATLFVHNVVVWRTGQLESILNEHGIEDASKKAWLPKALAFVEVAEWSRVADKYPFNVLHAAIEQLSL